MKIRHVAAWAAHAAALLRALDGGEGRGRLDATEKLVAFMPNDMDDILDECREQQVSLAEDADDGDVAPAAYHKQIEALKDQCIAAMNKDGRISRWKQQSPDDR